MINCVCKGHRDKIKVPDPVVKDLISKKIVKQIIKKKSKADFTVRKVYGGLRCSLKRSLSRRFVSPMYCLWQRLQCTM